MRREFVSTHRPKLRVRKVILHPLAINEPIKIQCEIANVGDTEAMFLRAEISIVVEKSPSHGLYPTMPEAPYMGAGSYAEPRTIRAGGHLLVAFTTSLSYLAEPRFARKGMTIRGAVRYKDAHGVERQTEFERVNVRGTNRFAREDMPDPDYEFED